jgi:tetratricopeptide (TPR) repeat protein
MGMRIVTFAAVTALAGAAAPAVADEPTPEAQEKPWSRGVSAEQKQTAQRLLEEGNDLFVRNQYREALARYQEAIASWDHPAIRFNVVRALIALDRPLDAYENLEKSLAYGKEPLEEQVYAEALNYQRLLAGQIAELEVTCKQPGVKISVDGEPFLDCPGNRTVRTTPGTHAVVGTKEGFMTSTHDVVLMPGKKEPVDVSLASFEESSITRQRWATWKPWAVAGGGAVIAGLGVLLNVQAGSTMDDFEREVANRCAGDGCTAEELEGSLGDRENLALLENKVAIGMMITGGAVVVTGVTLVILNRPRTYVPESGTRVVPTVSGDGAGVSLMGRW